ncbi:MAG TPA: histidine kinase [Gemmatimonadales bacterium]
MMLRRMSLPRVVILGATVLGLLTSAQHFMVMQRSADDPTWRTVQHALNKEMPFWYLWALLAPIVVWVLRRVPLARGRLALAIPVHAAVAIACILLHGVMLLAIYRLTGWPVPTGPFWQVYREGILFRITLGLLAYTILFGTVLAADYYDRFRERERAAATLSTQLAEARVQALRMQLNPHFLFNTLNTVSMLVRQQANSQAVRMLAGLSGILRYVLEDAPPQEVTLRQEIDFIERYLAIEQSRFPDRLQVTVTAEPGTLEAMVPNLILQPLVENAIRHGIARRAAAGQLQILAARRGARLELEVRDDGPGFDGGVDPVTPPGGVLVPGAGIGLPNTIARLEQMYGPAGTLTLESPPAGGTIARVTLPFRLGTVESEVPDAVGAA